MCFKARLVQGRQLYFDATKVEANASLDSTRPRSLVENRLEEHLAGIFPRQEEQPTQGGSERIAALLALPACRKRGRHSQRRTPDATVGLKRPEVSTTRIIIFAPSEGPLRQGAHPPLFSCVVSLAAVVAFAELVAHTKGPRRRRSSRVSAIVHEFEPFTNPLFTNKPNSGTVVLELGRVI
jgi:hypothetical protein